MNLLTARTAAVLIAVVTALQSPGAAQAQDPSQAMQAARAKAAKMQMMKMKQAQAAQASMAAATVTAATLAATEAGECSPYLAKWMMTRNPMWRLQYEACMED
jgi:uncharacterized MAPEG superfamily protein